jgi:endonuclease III-like uncharacterized protein
MAEMNRLMIFRQAREKLVALAKPAEFGKTKARQSRTFTQRIMKAFDDLNVRQSRLWEH